MFRRPHFVFSPVELEYLELNQKKPVEQLAQALAKSRSAIIRQIAILNGKEVPGKKNKVSVIGKRKDLGGLFMRSGWEADFCRYLKYKGIKFFYEPKVFVFEKIKHGTVSYLPDLYLPETDEYIEIKGQLTSQGRTAVRRFKQFYPDEFKKLKAVTGSLTTKAALFFQSIGVPIYATFNDLKRDYRKIIPNWESQ
jgi:hypothetical protein